MTTDFQRLDIDGKEWGLIKILRPIVRDGEDPWGGLAPLKGSPYERLIPVVSGEALSHAQHGYLRPLLKVIGPDPKVLGKLVPKEYRKCGLSKSLSG